MYNMTTLNLDFPYTNFGFNRNTEVKGVESWWTEVSLTG